MWLRVPLRPLGGASPSLRTGLSSAPMRIAVVQCPPVFDDASGAGDVIVDRLRRADAAAVDLVVFPEAFLLGHSYDSVTIRVRARAVTDGALAELCRRVAAFRATLVVGAFEAVGADVFNTGFVIARGRIVGRYRKARPNEPGVCAGADSPTFLTAGTRYGINICNDANHPDVAQRMADRGAAVIVYPLNNLLRPDTAERWRARSLANLVERARQTGCWIASSDVAGTAGDRVSFGCTAIVAPDGSVVARVPEGAEGVAVRDVAVAG